MCSNRPEACQRLFFALWPDAAVRQALAMASRELLGRRIRQVPAENLHLTLAFAGSVTAPVRACLEAAAGAVRAAPFELTVDHVGHWPRPRVLWAGPTHTPGNLWSLVEALNRAFDACGLQRETRPFQAHVTLARKIVRPPPLAALVPVTWSIGDFSLVESVTDARGARYRRLVTWTLEDG
ncbi:MAG TPA: RNA 2',3'-cyclic phosphodiesterase [Gammaproteobacteria bacterium]|nr:RNA 2',3'-cyclic phosphodiesterase [Gammaproteobacteria bacterium]